MRKKPHAGPEAARGFEDDISAYLDGGFAHAAAAAVDRCGELALPKVETEIQAAKASSGPRRRRGTASNGCRAGRCVYGSGRSRGRRRRLRARGGGEDPSTWDAPRGPRRRKTRSVPESLDMIAREQARRRRRRAVPLGARLYEEAWRGGGALLKLPFHKTTRGPASRRRGLRGARDDGHQIGLAGGPRDLPQGRRGGHAPRGGAPRSRTTSSASGGRGPEAPIFDDHDAAKNDAADDAHASPRPGGACTIAARSARRRPPGRRCRWRS